jgi:hypothetical protein
MKSKSLSIEEFAKELNWNPKIVTQRLNALGHTHTCSRCGGIGRYSFNLMDGDTCYGCGGSGKQINNLNKELVEQTKKEVSEGKLNEYFEQQKLKIQAKKISEKLTYSNTESHSYLKKEMEKRNLHGWEWSTDQTLWINGYGSTLLNVNTNYKFIAFLQRGVPSDTREEFVHKIIKIKKLMDNIQSKVPANLSNEIHNEASKRTSKIMDDGANEAIKDLKKEIGENYKELQKYIPPKIIVKNTIKCHAVKDKDNKDNTSIRTIR